MERKGKGLGTAVGICMTTKKLMLKNAFKQGFAREVLENGVVVYKSARWH